MPPKPDLVFNTPSTTVETDHRAFNVQLSPLKPKQDFSHTSRSSAPIIKDWVSDSEEESKPKAPQQFVPSFDQSSEHVKTPRHSVQPIESTFQAATSVPASLNVALPNITVTRPRYAHQVITKSTSPIRRHITRNPSSRTSNSPLRVNAVQVLVVSAAQGDMSYLSEFEELNEGYVAFGGKPKGGKITGKGKIKTVLLRVPRENNMYYVNLKNIVPSGDLTCLFAKATLDESNLWHRRLAHDETSLILKTFLTGLKNQLSLKMKVIKSDNGTEFKNYDLNQFCGLKGIKREFSVPRTPQQNDIAERKNRTLIEAARTMLADSLLPIPFWDEAVNTACYVQNRVLVSKPHNKTPYELLHGRTPSIDFMTPFGCPVTILNTLDPLGNFQRKVDEGFLVGYTVCSKAFRVFNSRTRIIQETLHVHFLENKPNVSGTGPKWLFDIDSLTKTMNYQPVHAGNQSNSGAGFQDNLDAEKAGEEVDQSYMLFPVWSSVGFTNPQNNAEDVAFDGKEHDFDVKKPKSKVILSLSRYRDLNAEFQDCSKNCSNEVTTASSTVSTVGQNSLNNTNTFSDAGPSNTAVNLTYGQTFDIDASQLLNDPDMPGLEDIIYSDDEDVFILLLLVSAVSIMFLLNKKDERGIVIRNKARLLAQGHIQEEGINYKEVFSPVARIGAIRLFLAYGSFVGFMVYQIDVKSAFLHGTIEEEVYVYQPLGFEDPDHPDNVYKVLKALYGLHQAPRA
nr:retrovirus-related Pol polyprotein from transposon TNT 1-94 [Tanacetum cinerariifolium]